MSTNTGIRQGVNDWICSKEVTIDKRIDKKLKEKDEDGDRAGKGQRLENNGGAMTFFAFCRDRLFDVALSPLWNVTGNHMRST